MRSGWTARGGQAQQQAKAFRPGPLRVQGGDERHQGASFSGSGGAVSGGMRSTGFSSVIFFSGLQASASTMPALPAACV